MFRLYMARHHYPEAAKTAIIVASEEQINGINFNTRLLSVCLYICLICMTPEVCDSTSAGHCMMSVLAEIRGNEIADGLARGGSALRFLGPEPALGVSR